MARVSLETVPPEEAIRFFRAKHDLRSFDWRDLWQAEHAAAFTVAKSAGFDILGDIRESLDQALAEGATGQAFKKRLKPLLQAKGWWGRREVVDPLTGQVVEATLGTPRRLQTIYRTNLRTAYAAGQWERIQRVKGGMPYLAYYTAGDERVRDEHRRWHGTVLPVDHPWWQTHFPPNDWGCRCKAVQLSRRQLEQRGLEVSEEPSSATRSWRNKRTGKVETVPEGVGPGWAYNPGAVRGAQLGRVLADKIGAMPEPMARAAVQDMLGGSGARYLMAGKPDAVPLPVTVLPPVIERALGGETLQLAMLSAATAARQVSRHGDVGVEDYAVVQQLVDRGRARVEGSRHVGFMGWVAGQLWKAVVKWTADGRERHVTTLRRATPRNLRAFERRGELLRDEAPGGP